MSAITNLPYIRRVLPINAINSTSKIRRRQKIALIPRKHAYFIELADQFSDYARDYILGKSSLPHIPIADFHSEDNTNYTETIAEIKELQINAFAKELKLDKIETKHKERYIWINMLPTNMGINYCLNLRNQVLKILDIRNIEYMDKYAYIPYLTLARVNDTYPTIELEKIDKPNITDIFCITLGVADEYGQFVEIVEEL